MTKKIIIVGALGIGIALLSGNSMKILGKSYEINKTISSETPEEEKSYYVENKETLFRQKEDKKAYEVYYYTLKVQKCEAQELYLQALQEEIRTKINIENEKLKLGYTTKISVDELEVQLKETQAEIETLLAQKDYYMEVIRLYGVDFKTIDVSSSVPLARQDYLNYFLEDNVQINYYEYQLKTYQKYLDKYSESEDKEDIEIQKELLVLERKEYEAELQVYVKGKVLQYESILRNITQVNEEISLLEEKIETNKELYKNGKIAEIQIMELETEQKRLMYEQKNLIYDAQCIRYILEHRIEGIEI